MYSAAPLPLAHAHVASSSSSKTKQGDLEDSLLQMAQEHHHASIRLHELTDKAKNDAIKKAACVAELLVEAMNGGVKELFSSQKQIELEIRALAATISRFIKQSDLWLSVTHSMNTAIKETGDFDNWMKTTEFDSRSINAAIYNIHQAWASFTNYPSVYVLCTVTELWSSNESFLPLYYNIIMSKSA